MPAIILSDNGATSGSAGLKTSGGNDGVLQLQTTTSGGTPTTAISISNTQVVTYTNQPTYTGGTANGVLYLNGSKAVTSGTALVFDGTNLGVGVTPSAWGGSGVKAMDIAAATSLAGSAGSADMYCNTYYNGTNFIFKANNYAARYTQNVGSGFHAWYTSNSGSAGGTISFTQAMTLDASGNLLVGTTSNSGYRIIAQGTIASNTASGTAPTFLLNQSGVGAATVSVPTSTNALAFGLYDGNAGAITERARIDTSGNLLVGCTSLAAASETGVVIQDASSNHGEIKLFKGGNTNNEWGLQCFTSSGASRGGVLYSDTQVSFSTTSDYRLKEDVAPMTGALNKVAQLKPVTYKWKIDGSDGQGFIAHELQSVVPECVTGEKDAVDSDGNPQYQGIDVSFLVATLTAAIQEQQTIIETLTNRITALEQT